ncbi:MAG TPA: Uma2 family endonuclease, partial [Solirubrobacteraceae bacterium]|nr:Uma2 family endonuclease [Solirubrobacteraceae bacterium]
AGLLRPGPNAVYLQTAALAIEVVSPGDETWEKVPFYATHGVDELLILDPQIREVHWLGLLDGEYRPIARSTVVDLEPEQLQALIEWPPLDG